MAGGRGDDHLHADMYMTVNHDVMTSMEHGSFGYGKAFCVCHVGTSRN